MGDTVVFGPSLLVEHVNCQGLDLSETSPVESMRAQSSGAGAPIYDTIRQFWL